MEELRRPGRVFTDCEQGCPEMVVVPAGTFVMGSAPTEEGRYDNEGPRHVVTIPAAFAVGVYEVTDDEWRQCEHEGGCPADVGEGMVYDHREALSPHPYVSISWEEVQEYVGWLSRSTGHEYRLLSEAEWEYVARQARARRATGERAQRTSVSTRTAWGAGCSLPR